MSVKESYEGAVRFLVEEYYDVQKLRIEAFNRVVAYVQSQQVPEIQNKGASQATRETQRRSASHVHGETQGGSASQSICETQLFGASHLKCETHLASASHSTGENHEKPANKPSLLARLIISGKVEVPKAISDVVWYHNMLRETERQLAKRLDAWSSHHKIRITFLSEVKGIGPILSSALIAWLAPISRFENISKLWSYCGLAPGQKRERGKKLNYNPRLKTLMWKVASSFEKQQEAKSKYRKLYTEKKAYYLKRPDLACAIEKKEKGAKLHVRLLAMRFTAKRFLADFWVAWRKLEGLPVTEPYAVAILGHTLVEDGN